MVCGAFVLCAAQHRLSTKLSRLLVSPMQQFVMGMYPVALSQPPRCTQPATTGRSHSALTLKPRLLTAVPRAPQAPLVPSLL